jgi:DNA-binding MarR family transcriptional regulator
MTEADDAMSPTKYLLEMAAASACRKRQHDDLAERLGVTPAAMSALLAASVKNPGCRWSIGGEGRAS